MKKDEGDKKKTSSSATSSATSSKKEKLAKVEEPPVGENVFGIGMAAEEDESDSKAAGTVLLPLTQSTPPILLPFLSHRTFSLPRVVMTLLTWYD